MSTDKKDKQKQEGSERTYLQCLWAKVSFLCYWRLHTISGWAIPVEFMYYVRPYEALHRYNTAVKELREALLDSYKLEKEVVLSYREVAQLAKTKKDVDNF